MMSELECVFYALCTWIAGLSTGAWVHGAYQLRKARKERERNR